LDEEDITCLPVLENHSTSPPYDKNKQKPQYMEAM